MQMFKDSLSRIRWLEPAFITGVRPYTLLLLPLELLVQAM